MFRAELLKERRLALGLRPEPVAMAAKRSTAQLHNYEMGRVSPKVEVLEDWAAALNSDPRDFFVDEVGS